jgi:serine protease AprX
VLVNRSRGGIATAPQGPVRGLTASSRIAAFVGAAFVVAAIAPAALAGSTYDPTTDAYSMRSTTSTIGATAWWNAGYTGKGVGVAIIDTGVSPVEGLATSGKLVYGPDLSFESQNLSFRNLDTNGHGTFMAGLIAGKDSTLTAPYASAPASAYRGIAPDARIVSVKVGVADGGVDVSQVIAAIDWVVQHKNDNGLNIRVINLSYGTNSTQSSILDPLSYAAEQAWKHGIVVVAAAGNSGYQHGSGALGLADPAYNRYIIGVGGYDTLGTLSTSDDTIGDYSASVTGCGSCKNPDFVAVGSHLQGLRVQNGFLDLTHPEGILGTRYFRGSGTSEAAAITSGAIALILQKYPWLTPDSVKSFVANGARGTPMPNATGQVQGNGELNLGQLATKSPTSYVQSFTNATGTGSLDAARGTDRLTSSTGVVLSGEIDIFGHTFNSTAMAYAEAAATSWTGGIWNGNAWTGSAWATATTWGSTTWLGRSWSGETWASSVWSSNSWSGRSWSGGAWSGRSWSGRSWSGRSWSGGSWS